MHYSLPAPYIQQMAAILGRDTEQFQQFMASYDAPRAYGLRINSAKLTDQDPSFLQMNTSFELEPIPWCRQGYYYQEHTRPGKHPYHEAGLYYLQEPSAMTPAELLNPQPGETVLDLAAAPGGKSTQLAAKLGSTGLLIANEIHPARSLILSENLERMGAANTIVLNAPPDKLAERFPQFFDKVLLDAPCSGEGMFRKNPAAIQEWSPAYVTKCAERQLDILQHALQMLKPGGMLAYSTCTFNRQENEEVVNTLLKQYPYLKLELMERIWPHQRRGEGHFVAIVRRLANGEQQRCRQGGKAADKSNKRNKKQSSRQTEEAWVMFESFAGEALAQLALPDGEPLLFGQQLYWLPRGKQQLFDAALLGGLRCPRPGLHLASLRKNRVEPAHALALALSGSDFKQRVCYHADSAELRAYLRGEAIPAPPEAGSGWLAVCVDEHPLGWAKSVQGWLKNHYPKGLRQP